MSLSELVGCCKMIVKISRSWGIFWRCQKMCSQWRIEEDCCTRSRDGKSSDQKLPIT